MNSHFVFRTKLLKIRPLSRCRFASLHLYVSSLDSKVVVAKDLTSCNLLSGKRLLFQDEAAGVSAIVEVHFSFATSLCFRFQISKLCFFCKGPGGKHIKGSVCLRAKSLMMMRQALAEPDCFWLRVSLIATCSVLRTLQGLGLTIEFLLGKRSAPKRSANFFTGREK